MAWANGPYGCSTSSKQAPNSTRPPSPCTSAASSATRRLLPMPASAATTTNRVCPADATRHRSRSSSRSATRPTKPVGSASSSSAGGSSGADSGATGDGRVRARRTRSRRSDASSLRSSDDTCDSTVRSEMNSAAAISAFVRLSTTRSRTSASRRETPPTGVGRCRRIGSRSGADRRNVDCGPRPRSSTVPTSTSAHPAGSEPDTTAAVATLTTTSPQCAAPRRRPTRFTAGPK